jgi:hypothetical protein
MHMTARAVTRLSFAALRSRASSRAREIDDAIDHSVVVDRVFVRTMIRELRHLDHHTTITTDRPRFNMLAHRSFSW